MLGIKYIKAQPNTYILQYRRGKTIREGAGVSFFYYAPTTSLVAVPLASVDMPFIFNEVTADFQEVTVQGQVTYRVHDARKLAGLLNFTLAPNARTYVCDDPAKLPQRVVNEVQVLMQAQLKTQTLRECLKRTESLVGTVREGLAACEALGQLGVEVLALSVLALKPNPETARALEAEMREQLLLEADEAIYRRRNAAVEQERAIKENELNTEVAVETKKRQIRETRIEADRAVQQKRQSMRQEEMTGNVTIEQRRCELVELAVTNRRAEADAEAYAMDAAMAAFRDTNPKVLQALAMTGMDPAQLIASAFQNLAENAEKIGTLNIAPELLQELINATGDGRRAA